MCKLHNNSGFTLIELLIAIVIISIGTLGIVSLTTSIMAGNRFTNKLTTATILAQDKLEEVKGLRFIGSNVIARTVLNAASTEDYNTIDGFPAYRRETSVAPYDGVQRPANEPPMALVTVTVLWKSGSGPHSVVLQTIIAE